MHWVKKWLRVIGGFYIFLGAGFFPPINELRLPYFIPLDVPVNSVAYKAIVDWTFFFGLDQLVIGIALLYAARKPQKNTNLIWMIIWLEAVRILADIYYMFRGYASIPVYVGFIVLHFIIILTGIKAVSRVAGSAEGA